MTSCSRPASSPTAAISPAPSSRYPQVVADRHVRCQGTPAEPEQDPAIVQFNGAVLTDGIQISVSADSVDVRQQSLDVRTVLDRRLYAPRVAVAFVSGLGVALTDIDIGGGTGISRPEATVEQGFYSGLVQVGNNLADEFVRSAPQGPLISRRLQQIIGVLVTQNVGRCCETGRRTRATISTDRLCTGVMRWHSPD